MEKYDEYIVLENEVEELISEVINDKYEDFNKLLKKPEIYGVNI